MSSEAAAELGRLRWKGTTKAERVAFAEMLKQSKTPARRTAIAKKAAQARWSKAKEK